MCGSLYFYMHCYVSLLELVEFIFVEFLLADSQINAAIEFEKIVGIALTQVGIIMMIE